MKKIWYLCNLFSIPVILSASLLLGKSHGNIIIYLNIIFLLCMILPLVVFHYYKKNIENYALFTQLSIVILTSLKVYFMGGMAHTGTPVYVSFIAPIYALTLPNKKRALFVYFLLIGLMISASLLNPYSSFKFIFANHILGFLVGISFVFFTLFYYTTQLQIAKQLEKKRVYELDDLKTKFFTHIAHEYRAPLSVIIGASEHVLKHPKTWLFEGHEIITRNAKNLIKLSNKLLELSKIESKLLPIYLVQDNIVSYIQYLIESFYSLAETKKIKLEFKYLSNDIIMDFDPDKIQDIISNLLSNAIKFTPRHGSINVSLMTENIDSKKHLTLIFKDSGIGIPSDEINTIFNRFYQAKNHLEALQEGTGLGLALTQELIKLHGGQIKVRSKINEGTIFTIHLPISNNARKTQLTHGLNDKLNLHPSSENLLTNTLNNKEHSLNILIVEDNSDVASYLSALLFNKYNVTIAQNGNEGLSKAFRIIPDLIISDVKMPDVDGFTLCKTLKEDLRTSHIPIILLTALADQKSKLEGLDVGADAYLIKPFVANELFIRIDKLIALRKSLQEYYSSLIHFESINTSNNSKNNKEKIFIYKVRKTLEKNIADEDFGISQLCSAMAMSRSQFYRKFSSLTDLTVHQYLMKLKLNKAKELLLNSNLNVSQVAFDTGFKNLSHFSRVFTKEYGYNPSKIINEY